MINQDEIGGIFLDREAAFKAIDDMKKKLDDDRYELSVWKVPIGVVFLEDLLFCKGVEQVGRN